MHTHMNVCGLPYTAKHFKTLQHAATHCNTLQHSKVQCNKLQHSATHCNTLQHIKSQYNTPKKRTPRESAKPHTTTHCKTLQHPTTHCNALQHTATYIVQHTSTHPKRGHPEDQQSPPALLSHSMTAYARKCV